MERLKQKMIDSADRLKKLIQGNAPEVIVCNEVALLFGTALTLYGKIMGAAMGDFLIRSLRPRHGMCVHCLKPVTDKGGSNCIKCKLTDNMESEEDGE